MVSMQTYLAEWWEMRRGAESDAPRWRGATRRSGVARRRTAPRHAGARGPRRPGLSMCVCIYIYIYIVYVYIYIYIYTTRPAARALARPRSPRRIRIRVRVACCVVSCPEPVQGTRLNSEDTLDARFRSLSKKNGQADRPDRRGEGPSVRESAEREPRSESKRAL